MNQHTRNMIVEILSKGSTVSAACEQVKVSRESFYKHLRSNPQFAADVLEAKKQEFNRMSKIVNGASK